MEMMMRNSHDDFAESSLEEIDLERKRSMMSREGEIERGLGRDGTGNGGMDPGMEMHPSLWFEPQITSTFQNQDQLYSHSPSRDYWPDGSPYPLLDHSLSFSTSSPYPSTSISTLDYNPHHQLIPSHTSEFIHSTSTDPNLDLDWLCRPLASTSTSTLPSTNQNFSFHSQPATNLNDFQQNGMSLKPSASKGKARALDDHNLTDPQNQNVNSTSLSSRKKSKASHTRTRIACLPCRNAKRKCFPTEGIQAGAGVCEPCRKRKLGEEDCKYEETEKAKEVKALLNDEEEDEEEGLSDEKEEGESDENDEVVEDEEEDQVRQRRKKKKRLKSTSSKSLQNPLLLSFSSKPPVRRKDVFNVRNPSPTIDLKSFHPEEEIKNFSPRDTFDPNQSPNQSQHSEFDEIKNRFYHTLPARRAQAYASDFALARKFSGDDDG